MKPEKKVAREEDESEPNYLVTPGRYLILILKYLMNKLNLIQGNVMNMMK